MRVFITGASAGLGRALAVRYAHTGAILGLVARRGEMLRAIASGLSVPTSLYPLDVRDEVALKNAAANFIATHGVPDIVIANAGMSIGTDLAYEEDLTVLQEIMDVNFRGMANTFQPFIGAMQHAGTGVLVGIASVAGYRGVPGTGAYCASKAAAIAFLESLRVELRSSGLRVLTVCPGYIDTELTARNPYRMPFIMNTTEAAAKIAGAIERRRGFVVIPWQMAVLTKLLRILPNAIFDRVFARAPRKPRRS
jgi:short-subunit dehydrogenase